eukprot:10058524-Lingulodinium_polyedra.AAC.1
MKRVFVCAGDVVAAERIRARVANVEFAASVPRMALASPQAPMSAGRQTSSSFVGLFGPEASAGTVAR